jgi:non-specific serine/threonine protein kinase
MAERLLSKCPKLTILATSREALAIAGEIVWLVPPLQAPAPFAPVNEIMESEAVRLFVERATAALPTFRITNQNAQTIATLCREVDGIPLAIELAAARVKMLSVEQLAQRLARAVGDRFQLLSGGSRTAGRHQTLRAAIQWSYDLLPEAECVVFRRLAVFAGGFTLEAAEAGCRNGDSDVLNLLAHLVDKSLAMVEGDRRRTGYVRYRVLDTLRQYGREKLTEAGEAYEAQEKHAQFFLNLVDTADAALTGPDQLMWLNRLDAEHDNLREALRWLESAQANEERYAVAALSMVAVLWKFWTMRGYQREGFDTIRRVLTWPATSAPSAVRLRVLNGGGFLGQELGEQDAIRLLLEEALATATALESKEDMAITLDVLSSEAITRGNYAQAQDYAGRGLMLWRELGNVYHMAQSVVVLGLLPLVQGDYAKALTLLEEGVAGLRKMGNTNLLAYSLRQLARAAAAQGRLEKAIAHCRESLKLNLELQSEIGVVACLAEFVDIAIAQGTLVWAAQLAGAVDAYLTSSGKELLAIERVVFERNQRLLAERLNAKLLDDARETGIKMSIEQAAGLVSEDEFDAV